MLDDQDRSDMLADAKDLNRRKSFSVSRELVQQQPMSGKEYLQFLQEKQGLFSSSHSPHKSQGRIFKL